MIANNRQVGGNHYRSEIQHWDYVVANELDYFQAQITKYVSRYKKKNGITDLEKAKHFLEKLIEIETNKVRDQAKVEIDRNAKVMQPIERGPLPSPIARRAIEQEHPFGFDKAKDI